MKARLAAALAAVARETCDLAAFLVPAIVYVASASPDPGAWDAAELQGVPWILGISHPTGFPFYVLIGYAWSHLLPLGTIAFRMNVMSGIAMAAAALAAYLLARELGAPRVAALLASLWFGFAHDIWAHASRAETHDVALALSAFAIYAFVRWMRGASDANFLVAFALYGLSLATHPNALWILPGLIVGAIVSRRTVSVRLASAAAALVVAGLSLYLYLPLRSSYVVAHHLDPSGFLPGAYGGIFWNYNDPHTLAGLRLELTGSESGTPGFFLNAFNPAHYQDALWSLYSGAGEQFGAFALTAAAFGLAGLWRREWRVALTIFLACTACLLFAVTYANEADVGRYKMLSLWMIAPLLAIAAPRSDDIAGAFGRFVYGVFLALGVASAFVAGAGFFNHPPRDGGRWVIDAARAAVPRGSVLMAPWLDATSLAYGAYIDGSLPEITVVSGWKPEMIGFYRQWARDRRVFILDAPDSGADSYPGVRDLRALDKYHELFEIKP